MPLTFVKTRDRRPDPHSPFGDDHYSGLWGELVVGVAFKLTGGLPRDQGRWSWGVRITSDDARWQGVADTLEEAQAKMQEAWQKWLDWARLQERNG